MPLEMCAYTTIEIEFPASPPADVSFGDARAAVVAFDGLDEVGAVLKAIDSGDRTAVTTAKTEAVVGCDASVRAIHGLYCFSDIDRANCGARGMAKAAAAALASAWLTPDNAAARQDAVHYADLARAHYARVGSLRSAA